MMTSLEASEPVAGEAPADRETQDNVQAEAGSAVSEGAANRQTEDHEEGASAGCGEDAGQPTEHKEQADRWLSEQTEEEERPEPVLSEELADLETAMDIEPTESVVSKEIPCHQQGSPEQMDAVDGGAGPNQQPGGGEQPEPEAMGEVPNQDVLREEPAVSAVTEQVSNQQENPQQIESTDVEVANQQKKNSEDTEPVLVEEAAERQNEISEPPQPVENEGVGRQDHEDNDKDADAVDPDGQKKPMLKLASFADLGSNGITDDTPVQAMDEKNQPVCQQCGKPNTSTFASIVWETMQFCNVACLAEYQKILSKCSSCKEDVVTTSLGKYCVRFGADIRQFCSNKCLEDYKKGLKVCCYCQKDISGPNVEGFLAPIGDKGQFKDFCAQGCLKKYEVLYLNKEEEKEVGKCAVCGEEKILETTLIQPENKIVLICGRPCLSAYKFANTVDSLECDTCHKDYDLKVKGKVIYHDGKSHRFCGGACQNVYIMQNRRIVPCLGCKVKKYNFDMVEKWLNEKEQLTFCSINCLNRHEEASASQGGGMPVIQSVSSLAGGDISDKLPLHPVPSSQTASATPPAATVREVVKETVVFQPRPKLTRNKGTLTKPFLQTKGVSCRPHPCHKETQTEEKVPPAIVPMVTPMYMPLPLHMYNAPYPVPVPVPVPIPVPIFIPTTRNSARGILKQIRKIQSKLPADPFEAELLAMAGALVDRKDNDSFDSDDFVCDNDDVNNYEAAFTEPVNDEGAPLQQSHPTTIDFESEIQGGRVVPKELPVTSEMRDNISTPNSQNNRGTKRRYSQTDEGNEDGNWETSQPWDQTRQQRRPMSRSRSRRNPKQARHEDANQAAMTSQEPKERPDAKHHLKFTYGVNAWRHWVVQKNLELEKAQAEGKYMKPFETDLLKLRADELNYTLCMFVKEVKKPNGENYAPDSVYYLALGIQEYLFENGRIDNIFTDLYYEPFTNALHDVVKDFKLPVNELGYFVTRIEEEHLWEAKQLGAHSPQVLLSTLIYFNTKYFMLKSVEQHRRLSFSHIMKHWKKSGGIPARPIQTSNNSQPKSILLRYYPPPQKGKLRDDRKCYEQHENIENPHRCPIRLYEFYLSKCPESMKTRSDLFYLQPERSCVSESPVWYSSNPLNEPQMEKMLHRLLMVREVQEHMLAEPS